jgi:uncharacterized protein (DUF433 family)
VTAHADMWRERLRLPAYKVGEAAFYTHISPNTVAAWTKTYEKTGLGVVSSRAPRQGLSYLQLIEVAVVAAMRSEGVKLDEIRRARTYFAATLDLEFPFAQAKFKTDGVDILLDMEGRNGQVARDKLLAANHSGQMIWSDMLRKRLSEFNYDRDGGVGSWKVNGLTSEIVIDPKVSFGAPTIHGIPTWVIKDRWSLGEGLGDISDDFSLTPTSVIEALKFEGLEVDRSRPNLWVN